MIQKVPISLLLCLLTLGQVKAQSVEAQSPTILVNFEDNEEAVLEIMRPSKLSTSGYTIVKTDHLDIEGIATDREGLKAVRLNKINLEFDNTGYFKRSIPLTSGSNSLTFEIVDERDKVTTVVFKILSEATDALANYEADIEIIKPEVLGKTRGFVSVKQKKLIIEGIVRDYDGPKDLFLNSQQVYFDSEGRFLSSVVLQDGPNLLSFKVVDKKGQITIKEFYLNKEESEALIASTGEYYALLIANESYDDPAILDLDYPVSDAKALKDLLAQKYAFRQDNVILLENPTREEIIEKLDFLSSTVTGEDNALIFYAGHGHWDPTSEIGYWLPKNAKKNSKAAWFRNSTLRDYIKEIRSKHTLLIADACFSGAIFKTRTAFSDAGVAINKMHELNSRKAMTSGTLKEVPDKSAFMKYLLKQLEDNEEKYVPAFKIFTSFRTAVMNNSANVPQYGTVQNSGDEGGDFIFVLQE